MPDYGARVADKAIRETERKLRTTYSTAQRELRKKLKTFNDKYKVKDAVKRKQLAEGKISKQDYADWKAGQVFQRKQWEAKVKEAVSVMTNSNEQAARIINEGRLDVFSENYNFLAFLGEKQLGISFDVYNTQSVARLIQDDPQILPEWKIDEEKDYNWNYKKVNNIVQQGIIQGEGIPEMTKRLCADLATQNENKMRMFARTAMTGAQNAGRQKQMEDAADMGIQVEKQWIATLDSRTRDWHRDRDGETVPYNEEFSGGLEYPGDPAGDPADVYNCRCTMITVYPEHAAYHEGGPRRASAEWTDEDGTKHQQSYLTVNPNVYEGWSEKAYRRWLEQKKEQKKIAQPEPKAEGKPKAPAEKKKRTTKTFDIDAATDIGTIEAQMIKQGLIAKGSSARLSGLEMESAKEVYRAYRDVIEKFPILKGKLLGVQATVLPGKDNTAADCFTFSGGHIRLNLSMLKDSKQYAKTRASNVRYGWHPIGTDKRPIYATVTHELGHALDGVLSKISGGNGSASLRILDMVLNEDEKYPWDSYSKSSIGSRISTYATRNEREFMAECISSMMNTSETDKSGMQKTFEKALSVWMKENGL